MPTRSICRVQRHHVERHARRGITQRLGHVAPEAVISVTRDSDRPESVILHVNSGGNAIAAGTALRIAGYEVDFDPALTATYGVKMRILPFCAA